MDDLSDAKIRNAAPTDKEYALADRQGLSVVVRPNGTKLWLYRYRFGGKRKNMSFGIFPGVGLKAAREKRQDAEKLLDQGKDPVAVREAKRKEDEKLKHTFRTVGEEWATTKLENENKAKATIKRERWNLAQLNREIGGGGRYLFSHDDDVPMSDNTINKALRIMGYDTGPGGDHCAHGFRSTASTLLNEEGAFDSDVVEAQLAHETDEKKRRRRNEVVRRQLAKGDKNKIRGIYDRAAYWSERVRLMQHWADRLDRLRRDFAAPLLKSA